MSVQAQLAVRRGREAVEFYKADFGTVKLLLIDDDPQAVIDRAVGLGATQVYAAESQHGWRLGRIEDPFGHHWEIGRPVIDWPPPSTA